MEQPHPLRESKAHDRVLAAEREQNRLRLGSQARDLAARCHADAADMILAFQAREANTLGVAGQCVQPHVPSRNAMTNMCRAPESSASATRSVIDRFEALKTELVRFGQANDQAMGERSEYIRWWPQLRRILRPGGLLVVDNANSHAEEMAPFVSLVKRSSLFTTCLVPVGNGEFLAVKSS